MQNIITKQSIIHRGPNKCHNACKGKTPCTEEYFDEVVKNHKIVYNTEKHREGLL